MKPFSLARKFRLSAFTAASLSLISSVDAQAYDRDVHYYVTTMILADLGGGSAISDRRLLAALANQYVDDNTLTEPNFKPFNPDANQRRRFHFPAERDPGWIKDSFGSTVRNSAFAKHNINRALQDNNPMLLGMALHTYMDSFAHEGYGGWVGHASAGHDPDRPHLNTDKFREMVRMVYGILQKWYKNNGQEAKPQQVSLDEYQKTAQFNPGQSGVFDSYEEHEIVPRENMWLLQLIGRFPNSGVRRYGFLDGTSKQDFEKIAIGYTEPDKADQCLDKEWWDNESGNQYNPLFASENTDTLSIETSEPTTSESKKTLIEGADNWSIKRLAKYTLNHPEIFKDKLIFNHLNNAEGISALMQFGQTKELYLYPLMEFNSESRLGSWDGYNDIIASYLAAPKLSTRLLAANMLSNNHPSEAICRQIEEVYAKIDVTRLNMAQRQLLLNTINPNSQHIATCAPTIVALLDKLLDYKQTSDQAAALLYLVSNDKERERLISSPSALTAMQSVRKSAIDALRQGDQAGGASSAAASSAENMLGYWQARSYEDFDPNDHASASDETSANQLAALLKTARESRNTSLAQAVASAAGTYEPEDNPPQALIEELGLAIADPNFHDVRAELGYALERVTGTMMNLDMLW